MIEKTEILIIGAGIPGLALGVALARTGFAVRVADAGPPPIATPNPQDGRTAALMVETLQRLEDLGVQGFENCAELRALRLIDPKATPKLDVTFEAREIGLEYYARNIPLGWLRAQLLKPISKLCAFNAGLVALEMQGPGKCRAKLENGQRIEADLVIGADGRNSPVRAYAQIDVWQHDYDQRAITCLLDHARPHHQTSTEFHYSGGPFTLVPMPGNTSALVWMESAQETDKVLKLPQAAFLARLQAMSQNVLGQFTLRTPPHAWSIRALKAHRLIADRIALVAEAAHVVPPTGAQGLNLSLRDVFALVDILEHAAARGEDIGAKTVLQRYAQARHGDIATRLAATDALNRLITSPKLTPAVLRQLGLRFFGITTPLRRILMRQGLAPALDLSKRAQSL